MVYPWCPHCSYVGATVVDMAGVCQHLTYSWLNPLPVMDISMGIQGGGVAIHAMLGGEFSSPHEQATMLVTD